MSIRIILPSFNRPAQCDLLLRSLQVNWKLDDLKIFIIHRSSTEDFAEGYRRLKYSWRDSWNMVFIDEDVMPTSFSDQVKNLITSSKEECIMFGTDDCVMFRTPLVSVKDLAEYVNIFKNTHVGFSLRLSPATILQNYLTGELQPRLTYNQLNEKIIEWNWKRYPRYCNYAYWFSWDFHAYSKELLISERIISKYWGIHRDIEHQLITDNELYNSLSNKMLACKESCVVVNTVNTVQTDGAIPAGTKHPYSVRELNDRFLAGEQISLRSFEGLNIISAHEEFPLIFERSEK